MGEPHSVRVQRHSSRSQVSGTNWPWSIASRVPKLVMVLFHPTGLAPRTDRSLLAVPSFSGSPAVREVRNGGPCPGNLLGNLTRGSRSQGAALQFCAAIGAWVTKMLRPASSGPYVEKIAGNLGYPAALAASARRLTASARHSLPLGECIITLIYS